MKFQKGVSGNPSGRPKGAVSEYTRKYAKLKGAAVDDYQKAYEKLMEAIDKGEGWAFQIFFKELVPKSKILDIEIDQNNHNGVEALTVGLIRALTKLETITLKEASGLLKTLGNFKLSESLLKDKPNAAELLTDEQIITIYGWLNPKSA